jgi:Glyoxalase-like domain
MNRSELDHLIVACATLDDGVDWVEERLGSRPVPGGQHVAMGTHNALLRLGERVYLEIIAVDPTGTAPDRPRWLALDEPEMQAQLASGPKLITWVVRSDSLANACARVPDLGEIMSMSRGDFAWRIAVPETGALPWGGVLPVAIQWSGNEQGDVLHPCDRLPGSGCELLQLNLSHPAAVLGNGGLMAMFRELKIVGPVELKSGPKTISARIRSPRGDMQL